MTQENTSTETVEYLKVKIRSVSEIAEHNRATARKFYEDVCALARVNPDRFDPDHADLFARIRRAKVGHELTDLIASVRETLRDQVNGMANVEELAERLYAWDAAL